MQEKQTVIIRTAAVFITAVVCCSLATAQNQALPSLAEQLHAQYKFVKMGSDSSGAAVIEEGTVLAVQKGGILGVPWTNNVKPCPATYQNATLRPPGKACTVGRGKGLSEGLKRFHLPGQVANNTDLDTSQTKYFKVGDKVYPTNIAVDLKNEKITFSIVACDTCNKTDPPTYAKSEVEFQFDKGFLEKGDVSKIEDTIAEVFALDNGDGQGGQDQGQAQGQAQPPADAQVANPPAQPEPQTIQVGQTPEQVQTALGKPEKVVDLGQKKIWVYKDLKITFVGGKVSDVQ